MSGKKCFVDDKIIRVELPLLKCSGVPPLCCAWYMLFLIRLALDTFGLIRHGLAPPKMEVIDTNLIISLSDMSGPRYL